VAFIVGEGTEVRATMRVLIGLLPVLGCAAMMGACAWMMRRGHRRSEPTPDERARVAELEEEVGSLRATRTLAGPEGDRG
jgi:hypothetical protein